MTSVRWQGIPSEDSDEDNDGGVDQERKYEQTLMYGRYKRELGDFAKEEARRLRDAELKVLGDSLKDEKYRGHSSNKCLHYFKRFWNLTFARVGEDWIFLALLGIIMAVISFLMDYGILSCNKARIWLYRDLTSHAVLQYLAWVSLPVCLILFSAGFAHILAPQAVGSGIPEMKTVLRGVVLKEYLTAKTLIAKVVGLTATLGSGLPLGKEGPSVHIASMVATLLSKAVTSFKGIYENESRHSEMLAAACAVGVAASFAAPVGGVLFSIEVTSVYFAVRNYWRGFFAAVCGAMVFRLLAVWFDDEETLTALFRTNFKVDYPFDPMEIFVFASMGAVCGVFGSSFVWMHREYVTFMRKNKRMKAFLQKSRLLYPFFVCLLYSTLSFPLGFGMFMAGDLNTHQQVAELFSNFTWTKEELSVSEFEIVEHWRTPWTSIFINLIIFMVLTFTGCVVGSTLPVPSGLFIPVFKVGAALGRIVGEAMALAFPYGLVYGEVEHIIIPGGYSIAGAAAFSGAVTHTISTSVIVFELTGQMTHIIPVMIAVLIANAVAQLLQPSIYDSIIQIKKLPYLPDILRSTTGAYNIYVEDFMIRDVKYIWYGITYKELKDILVQNKKIRSLPLVDSPDSMILLGSIPRGDLITLIEEHLGKEKRAKYINKWKMAALKTIEGELTNAENHGHCNCMYGSVRRKKERRKGNTDDLPPIGFVALEGTEGLETEDINWVPGVNQHCRPADPYPCMHQGHASENTPLQSSCEENAAQEVEADETTRLMSQFDVPKIIVVDSKGDDNMPDQQTGSQTRRLSRFEVTRVEVPENESSVTLVVNPVGVPFSSTPLDQTSKCINDSLPRKSILKKTNSVIFHTASSSPLPSLGPTPYATVHGGDTSRLKQFFTSVIRRSSLPRVDAQNITEEGLALKQHCVSHRFNIPADLLLEKTLEQQGQWEEEELQKVVDFSLSHIDPAPFQLVERTSLLKVHSLFSMLGLNHAYVTAIGRLIGVVGLKELRKAIEDTNSGEFSKAELADMAEEQRKQQDSAS